MARLVNNQITHLGSPVSKLYKCALCDYTGGHQCSPADQLSQQKAERRRSSHRQQADAGGMGKIEGVKRL